MINDIKEEGIEEKKLNTFTNKLKTYAIYSALSLLIPFIIFAISFGIFGENQQYTPFYFVTVFGLLLLISVNILFSYYITKRKLNTSIYSGIIVTVISSVVTYFYPVKSEIFLFNWLFLLLGDLVMPFVFLTSSILSWELIDKYLNKSELSNQEVEELN